MTQPTTQSGSGLVPTVGQTVGPFFHDALPWPGDRHLVAPGDAGAVRLAGRVLDGEGAPVPDALVELWQAGADGRPATAPGSLRRDGHTFTGFGRCATDEEGWWSFTTLPPVTPRGGAVAYVSLAVFARGLLDRLLTRAYLPGTPVDGTSGDGVLDGVAADRRATLVMAADDPGYRFDVRLQGEGETVFLCWPRDPRAGGR
ncbi:protocatechuate 3,4-dioxygenase subunit alpha [Nocardioides acrostichi]|uniref:Protocatechuate 3,4-dioxygenase subunit alpha n=1 Tax=Nocardioides acrostichi TaxID=2784339 RepID=A0A930UYD5_9ACTN|nr:protocatechuate 3,4-dioxygenase subunit alpha [Nocardioides acrostichi]MBF4161335.1 protocatechuate 3,4-dioxygenase subunit alpha [Nocardioides acrostichi]